MSRAATNRKWVGVAGLLVAVAAVGLFAWRWLGGGRLLDLPGEREAVAARGGAESDAARIGSKNLVGTANGVDGEHAPQRTVESAAPQPEGDAAHRALEGVVRDLQGHPIANAVVELEIHGHPELGARTTSGDDGAYRLVPWPSQDQMGPLHVLAGRVVERFLHVTATGFAPLDLHSGEIRESGEGDAHLDLWMTRGARLVGRVTNRDTGLAVAGAQLELGAAVDRGEHRLAHAVSGGDGSFVFETIPARSIHPTALLGAGRADAIAAFLLARAPGFAACRVSVDAVDEGETAECDVALVRAGSIRGRVVDPEKRPHAGVRIGLIGFVAGGAARNRQETILPFATTDEDGRYRLEDVPIAEDPAGYSLTAWTELSPGFRSSHRSVATRVVVSAGEEAIVPDLVVPRLAAIAVRVFDDAGRPLRGASVSSNVENGHLTTDPDGRVLLRTSTTAPRTLRILAQGFVPATVDPVEPRAFDPPRIEVRLERGHFITGRVVHADGTPAAGVSIDLLDASIDVATAKRALELRRERLTIPRAAFRDDTSTDRDGRFEFRELEDAPCHVAASRWPVASDTIEVLALVPSIPVDGEPVELTIPDAPAIASVPHGSILVELRDGDEPVIAFESLELENESTRIPADRFAAPGRVRFDEVPLGTWTLAGRVVDRAPFTVPAIVLSPDHPERTVTVALDPGVTLSGRVRDFAAMHSRNATLRALGPDAIAIPGRIDEDGAFVVRGLRPGETYQLELDTLTRDLVHWIADMPAPWVVAAATQELGEVAFVQGGLLDVELGDAAFDPRSAEVEVVCGPRHESVVLRPRQRHFTIALPPGPAKVSLRTADGAVASVDVTIGYLTALARFPAAK